MSTTRATTSERQRAGICGASEGPNGASDLLSGTASVSDAAARRKKSFSDARRDRTPFPDIGNDVLSSDIDVSVRVAQEPWTQYWSSVSEARAGDPMVAPLAVVVLCEGTCSAETKTRLKKWCLKKCTEKLNSKSGCDREGETIRLWCTTSHAWLTRRRAEALSTESAMGLFFERGDAKICRAVPKGDDPYFCRNSDDECTHTAQLYQACGLIRMLNATTGNTVTTRHGDFTNPPLSTTRDGCDSNGELLMWIPPPHSARLHRPSNIWVAADPTPIAFEPRPALLQTSSEHEGCVQTDSTTHRKLLITRHNERNSPIAPGQRISSSAAFSRRPEVPRQISRSMVPFPPSVFAGTSTYRNP